MDQTTFVIVTALLVVWGVLGPILCYCRGWENGREDEAKRDGERRLAEIDRQWRHSVGERLVALEARKK